MAFNIRKYLGLATDDPLGPTLPDDFEDPALMVTGDELINSIYENIKLRRSVLVTGPRGCGKSYCSEAAIRLARDHGVIGGWRFLQGNREIPRDTLSEDMLVVGEGAKVELVPALALRPIEPGGHKREDLPEWPGIPTRLRTPTHDPRSEWSPRDWTVLFLDEINRFGDGFLDSLLSLIEEGKIVRRGEEYYVPIVVVATANPPGYDVTAKKLSPPLQARITRAFRVSQPDTIDIVDKIMPSKLAAFAAEYPDGKAPAVPIELRYLAAGATLALWGDPRSGSKGRFFLTRASKMRLERLMDSRPHLADQMREISNMIEFGPDARAVTDWIGCAMALGAREGVHHITSDHLRKTAVHVLGHKVREKFNEGANPDLAIHKDVLLLNIVTTVLGSPELAGVFGLQAQAQAQPAQPARPTRVELSYEQVLPMVNEFQSLRPFADMLARGYAGFSSTVLPTQDHVLSWLNTLDACLAPYATPQNVRENVNQGFWAMVRSFSEQHQVSRDAIDRVADLYTKSFQAIAHSANPAGQERAAAAVRNVARAREQALASPSVPENAPGASGIRRGPDAW